MGRGGRQEARRNEKTQARGSAGPELPDQSFGLADAAVDRMIVCEVFRLRGPRGPERTAKTEELALRLQDISHRFTEFAFHFVRHFSR